jgi:hypothetical protein
MTKRPQRREDGLYHIKGTILINSFAVPELKYGIELLIRQKEDFTEANLQRATVELLV